MVFQRWQADALHQLDKHGHLLALLIVDSRTKQESSLIKKLFTKKWGTILFTFLDNRIFKPKAKEPVDLSSRLHSISVIHCRVSRKGYAEYFDDADSEVIREFRLDFILRFGFNIIRGNILTDARFGVWSFHHDNEMIYRGGPPGFWEIFTKDPVNGAIMQQLTNKLDGGIILQKGYLKTIMHSYRENINQLLNVSASWPARMADNLSATHLKANHISTNHTHQSSTTKAPIYKIPGNCQMVQFLLLLLRNRIRFYYRDLMAPEIWHVGMIMKPIEEVALVNDNIREQEVIWLPPVENSCYLADPAGFTDSGSIHILHEDYSYATKKAGISETIMEGNQESVTWKWKSGKRLRVLSEDNHLSYPFAFEHNNIVYCLPESYQSSKITLYKRDAATGKFVEPRHLLENVKAVDPTILFYEGKWWLFFTDHQYSNSHLYLYFSDALSGKYLPHPLNPVKTDIRSARPAGTPFIHDKVLFRPAQDCSVTYGGRIAINRVTTLTTDDFAEETVRFIEPVKGSLYNKGLHTISKVGNYTLIDGKRYRINLRFFFHQLRNKLFRKGSANV
jgi:hypothetical protein